MCIERNVYTVVRETHRGIDRTVQGSAASRREAKRVRFITKTETGCYFQIIKMKTYGFLLNIDMFM